MIASFVVLIVLAFGFFKPGSLLLNTAMFLCSFGTLAIIPPEMIGGTTVLASSVAFLILVGKQVFIKGQVERIIGGMLDYRKLGFLALFTLIAVLGAFTLPKIFAGQILVYPMRGVGLVSYVMPLQPSGSNFNQSINLTVDMGVVLSVYAMSRWSAFSERIKTALLWGAAAVILTGMMDMAFTAVGADIILEQFRTASYVLMDDTEIAGVRRVIGMMAESSSFGAISISFGSALFFCRYAWSPRIRLRLVYPLSIGCLIFALLSAASTAYGSLALFAALNFADSIWRLIFAPKPQRVGIMVELVVSFIAILCATALYLGSADLQRLVQGMLDSIIFKKTLSSSYLERSSWTAQGVAAFFSSHGIGVGIGSVRTSNFFANILASTGLLGSILFGLFNFRVFMARVPSAERREFELAHGAKLTLLVAFGALFLSGTTPDYGVFVAIMFGLIVGLSTYKKPQDSVGQGDVGEGAANGDTRPSRQYRPKLRSRLERL